MRSKHTQKQSESLGERTIDLFDAILDIPVYRSMSELKENGLFASERYVVRQYPYKTCYGTSGRIDAMVVLGDRRIMVECKFQRTSGTTDEKLPYVFKNFESCTVCNEFILLYDGHWWTDSSKGRAAIRWAKREADALSFRTGKGVYVLDWKNFLVFVKGLR